MDPLRIKLKNAVRVDRALKFVWQASYRYTILSGIVLAILGILPIASLYLIKLIIDESARLVSQAPLEWTDPKFLPILLYIGLACLTGLVKAIFDFMAGYLKKAQAMAVSDHMHSVIHEKSCQMDLAFFESPSYRNVLFRAQNEGPYRPANIVNGLFTAGQNGASFAAVAWLLILFNPALPVLMIAAVLPGMLMRLKWAGKIYAWQEKRTEDERRAYYFHWMLTSDSHAKELRLFNLGTYFMKKFKTIQAGLKKEKLVLEKQKGVRNFIAQAIALLAVFASLAYIAFKTVQGQISLGDMVMYLQAFQRGLGFLKSFMESSAQMYEDNLFLSHLYEFQKIRPDISTPDCPATVPQNIRQGIKFQNVTFSYPNCEKKILENVNFYIKPTEIVALVGENGSGKTTIVKLLTRLYDPEKGHIFLDGIDIKKFTPKTYRKKIGMVFQDHIRYHLPAEENIFLGSVENKNNKERIRAAAENSGIDKTIKTLNSGYGTTLGRWFKNGEELSAGQWQMLAVSRAFFRDADVVVFDEPSSALDPEAEERLFSRLKKLIKNHSALIVTHRYSSVKLADRIIVLDKGQIIEQGTHSELIKKNGKYAALYTAQAKAYQ